MKTFVSYWQFSQAHSHRIFMKNEYKLIFSLYFLLRIKIACGHLTYVLDELQVLNLIEGSFPIRFTAEMCMGPKFPYRTVPFSILDLPYRQVWLKYRTVPYRFKIFHAIIPFYTVPYRNTVLYCNVTFLNITTNLNTILEYCVIIAHDVQEQWNLYWKWYKLWKTIYTVKNSINDEKRYEWQKAV